MAFLLIGAAISMAWLVWHALHTIPPFDMRAEAARSDAVIYGVVGEGAGRRHVVVEEIWKSSSISEAELRVGSTIAVPQLPRDAHPERLVVFLERSSRDGKLHAGTIVAVNHGRLGWGPELSVEEAKAMCTGTQASNQPMPFRPFDTLKTLQQAQGPERAEGQRTSKALASGLAGSLGSSLL
jgi:hypothetical protein